MWPLGHAAGAYLLASVGAERDWLPRPSAALVVAVLFASQTPDLIDKPLAWVVPILPAGRSLGHSLFLVLPLCLGAVVLADRLGRRGVGLAVAVALLSHLFLDVLPTLWGNGGWRFLVWPLLTVDGFNSPPSILGMLEASLDDPYFHAEFLLAALAFVRWRADGWPGIAWVFDRGRTIRGVDRTQQGGD